MTSRNSKSPWNPAFPADLTPEEYEKQVVVWLRKSGQKLNSFEVQHRKHLEGPSGEYEFDAVAEFTILNGAQILVVIECKRYSRPVERDDLLTLWAKKEDLSAHKAMIFATCGFQSGALAYAKSKNMATITFVEGEFIYETRAADAVEPSSPAWTNPPDYVGLWIRQGDENKIQCTTISRDNLDPVNNWLCEK
jgi:restriction system protein